MRDKQGVLEEHQLIWIAEGSHPSEPSIQMLFNRIETDLSASALGIGWGEIMDPNQLEDAPELPVEPKIFSYSARYGRGADQSASPEWRRVFVLVHGEASVELVVRDLKDVE